MQLNQFHSLLDQISMINVRYKRINELTGENFNVFRILKLESHEVRMHSAFLAELLNPNGSHGQRDSFLKLFVEMFCYKQNALDTASCTVEIEKHTGFLNLERTEGGRIDILVTDKNQNQIIVENKIYAGDQPNQVLRYYKYSNKADLIYLSLYGKEPEEYSKRDLKIDEHYKCYSYSNHVIEWLEACRKEVTIQPIIRESLSQYINLIKHLTNQTQNDNMRDEIALLLSKNLESSFIIAENIDNACNVVLERFYDDLRTIADDLNLLYDYNIDFEINYRGFWFWRKDWQRVSITFQFWAYDKDLVYGFTAKPNPSKADNPMELDLEFKNQLKSLIPNTNKENGWWPLYLRMENPYTNWSKYEAWKAIQDGSMARIVKEKLQHLLKLTSDIDL
jgi:hypothetical protein